MSDGTLTTDGQVDVSTEAFNENTDLAIFDPPLPAELENLNTYTDRIKKLESELDKARADFRCLLNESSTKVNSLSKKLGSCVEKAKLCRDTRMYVKKFQSENTSLLESIRILPSHNESEKVVQQLHQELKKSIVKSCLSSRRSLLQLNNLVNQHQLQLLPYFEMKAQFNQMFEEQIQKVPPLDDSVIKMNGSIDELFHIEKSGDEILQQFKLQDELDQRGIIDDTRTITSNSVTSSYQNSLSSENVYLEHLTSEDVYKTLPPKLKPTPGLVNCSVSYSDNNYFKSSSQHSIDIGCLEDLSCKTSRESFSFIDMFCENESNGFQNDMET